MVYSHVKYLTLHIKIFYMVKLFFIIVEVLTEVGLTTQQHLNLFSLIMNLTPYISLKVLMAQDRTLFLSLYFIVNKLKKGNTFVISKISCSRCWWILFL